MWSFAEFWLFLEENDPDRYLELDCLHLWLFWYEFTEGNTVTLAQFKSVFHPTPFLPFFFGCADLCICIVGTKCNALKKNLLQTLPIWTELVRRGLDAQRRPCSCWCCYRKEQVRLVSAKAERPNHPSRCHARQGGVNQGGSASGGVSKPGGSSSQGGGGPPCQHRRDSIRLPASSHATLGGWPWGGVSQLGGSSATTTTTETWLHEADSTYSRARPKIQEKKCMNWWSFRPNTEKTPTSLKVATFNKRHLFLLSHWMNWKWIEEKNNRFRPWWMFWNIFWLLIVEAINNYWKQKHQC